MSIFFFSVPLSFANLENVVRQLLIMKIGWNFFQLLTGSVFIELIFCPNVDDIVNERIFSKNSWWHMLRDLVMKIQLNFYFATIFNVSENWMNKNEMKVILLKKGIHCFSPLYTFQSYTLPCPSMISIFTWCLLLLSFDFILMNDACFKIFNKYFGVLKTIHYLTHF